VVWTFAFGFVLVQGFYDITRRGCTGHFFDRTALDVPRKVLLLCYSTRLQVELKSSDAKQEGRMRKTKPRSSGASKQSPLGQQRCGPKEIAWSVPNHRGYKGPSIWGAAASLRLFNTSTPGLPDSNPHRYNSPAGCIIYSTRSCPSPKGMQKARVQRGGLISPWACRAKIN